MKDYLNFFVVFMGGDKNVKDYLNFFVVFMRG